MIDFTPYTIPAREPADTTRRWSLMGVINQKQTRPQDKPIPFKEMPVQYQQQILAHYPTEFEQ